MKLRRLETSEAFGLPLLSSLVWGSVLFALPILVSLFARDGYNNVIAVNLVVALLGLVAASAGITFSKKKELVLRRTWELLEKFPETRSIKLEYRFIELDHDVEPRALRFVIQCSRDNLGTIDLKSASKREHLKIRVVNSGGESTLEYTFPDLGTENLWVYRSDGSIEAEDGRGDTKEQCTGQNVVHLSSYRGSSTSSPLTNRREMNPSSTENSAEVNSRRQG